MIGVLCFNYVGAKPTVPPKTDVLINFGKARSSVLDPDSIKLLNWNIYKGGKNNFSYWFTQLAAQPDLSSIQEMLLNPKMKTIISTYSRENHMATSFIDTNNERTGVLSASKPIAQSVNFLKSRKTEPVVNTPKVILFTTYKIKNSSKELLLANIHAVNFVENKYFEDQILDAFKVIDQHKGPIIFSGDFNTWNKDRYYFLDKLCRDRGLNQVVFSPDQRMKFNGNPLDHVIYSPDLEVVDSNVLGFIDGSDHKPMTVTFKYLGP